jgi:two-component system C4-dicarboxylate transport sensor histidine kinase DctB
MRLTRAIRRWIVFGAVSLCLLAGATWFAGRLAADNARAEIANRARAAAALHAAVLRSELEKHRSLPFVLAEDPDVRDSLKRRTPEQFRALNQKLEELSDQTRAAVIYILDARGVTVAASNWRLPTSFVGMDYSFRPYFRAAKRGETVEHFALGVVSGHPGLFLARQVKDLNGEILGVVVVKVEFADLEREWRTSDDLAFVADAYGVVLVTSVPQWRFRTVRTLDPLQRNALRGGLQFGQAPLSPLPFQKLGRDLLLVHGDHEQARFVEASTSAAASGWRLYLLAPADSEIDGSVTVARSVTVLLGVLLIIGIVLLIRGRERALARTAAQERARVELEARVEERTRELVVANERLVLEMEERRRAEASREMLQDDLVQANKLATLGQIAAGVAHEINQPVAAIRTYADNAAVLLDRADADSVKSNLGFIANLTEQIGLITDELRAFSRKTSGRPQPVLVAEAITGTTLLLGWRAREQRVKIVCEPGPEGLKVFAERARLEQVLVNLVQNGLEALGTQAGGVIKLSVQASGQKVRITVSDNGPGLDPETAKNLFTPFVTTKTSGLGLGLVISRDLITEFGGDLSAKKSADGAVFVISLKKAP